MAKTKVTEGVKVAEGFDDATDYDSWVETFQDGFPPYWTPEPGKSFLAKPVMLDARDPEFPRVVFEAIKPLECQKGPVEDAEFVTVNAGEKFTVSLYSAFKDIDLYVGIPTMITSVEKKPQANNPKKSFWTFSGKVSPEDSKKLEAAKVERSRNQMAARETKAELTS